MPDDVLITPLDQLTILEETADGGLKIEGVALVDEAISANRRYYSEDFNNAAMIATNLYRKHGGKVTVYSRHGRAVGEQGNARHPVGLPVGVVTENLFRQDSEVKYRAFIAPTSEGRDVITLVRSKVLEGTSIRSNRFKSRSRRMTDGTVVEEMLEAVITGIDLCDAPGIPGAGITAILEEKPTWVAEEDEDEDKKPKTEEDQEHMDWEKVTLAELKEHCAALLEEYAADIKQKVTVLEGTVASLTEARVALVTERDTALAGTAPLQTEVGQLRLSLAIQRAAQIGVGRDIVEALEKRVKTAEEIAGVIEEVRSTALAAVLGQPPGKTSARGAAKVEDAGVDEEDEGGDTIAEEDLTADQLQILRFAGG